MVLNYIWIAFFLIAFVIATFRLVFLGDTEVFPEIINSTFSSSKTAFEISLGLTGVLSLWLGIMKIGEKGGVIALFSKLLSPIFCKLFPDIPKGHPVTGSIFMNLAANMLGLDNAATPLGLKAMEGLQELNPKKDTASNPMIMFLVLNTSGLTLIPISIMVYRAQMGAAQPTDVFVPILLATFFSTLAGIIVVSLYQRINLFNRTLLLFLGGMSLVVAGIIWLFTTLSRTQIDVYSTTSANVFLFLIIIGFILGPMFEENLRQALQASHGSWSIFVTRPICCFFLVIAVIFVFFIVRGNLKSKKAAEAKGENFDTAEEEG